MERSNMRTLYDLIEGAYQKYHSDLPYKSVEYILKNGNEKECVSFIRSVLHDKDYRIPDESSPLYSVAQKRARHSAITYLIGLAFQDFLEISYLIENSFYTPEIKGKLFYRLWMLTALYHDWGYYSERLADSNIVYRDKTKYYLFTDSYAEKRLHSLEYYRYKHEEAFAYEYEEIEAYDTWARVYHARKRNNKGKKNSEEKNELVDHGILGGVFVFNDLVKKSLLLKEGRIDDELFFSKTACLTIAQHNIFKSPNTERDEEYGEALKKIHSTSDFVIDRSKPLLLLLSLVDTFECVKRFSKRQNDDKYLETKTVLSCIKVSVTLTEITLNFEDLSKRIAEKRSQELQDEFENYIKALSGIHTWTCFAFNEEKNISKIVLNPAAIMTTAK